MSPKKEEKEKPQQEGIPKEFLLDRKCETCCEMTLKRIVYSSLGGVVASLFLFKTRSSRFSTMAFSLGLGLGSAYTDCSYLISGIPKWPLPRIRRPSGN